ncbi:MAG TPA: hypothetical protein VHO70_22670 [Chitinispirillaceae bacterium]|nr:hypothetical protein [Chitinispirillaceae bacterium]
MYKKIVQVISAFSIALLIGDCSQENPMQTSFDVTDQSIHIASSSTMVPDEVTAATDNTGITFCFARGTDGNIYYRYRIPGGSWTTVWQQKAGTFKGNIVMEKDKNNLLYLFAIGTDNFIKYIKQTSVGSTTWTNWTSLPYYSPLGTKIAVTTFGNGTAKQLMLFFHNWVNELFCSLQNSDNTFTNRSVLSGNDILGFPTHRFAVGKYSNGNVVLFASDINGILYEKFYNGYFGTWGQYYEIENYTGEMAIANNSDGRLELFVCNPIDHYYIHAWESAPGRSDWHWEEDYFSSEYSFNNISVARNPDGRLEIFFNGWNSYMYHRYQTAPNSGWTSYVYPFENGQPTTDRHIATATYGEDGRLCIFAVSNNSVHYSVQHGVNQWWESFVQFSNSF